MSASAPVPSRAQPEKKPARGPSVTPENAYFVAARRAPLWQVVIPVTAIAFLAYTIYKNIEGTSFPYDRFPFVVAAWLVVGLAITVVLPGLTRNIGARLAAREGLAGEA